MHEKWSATVAQLMEIALELIGLLVTVVVVAGLAGRVGMSAPLVLVVVGVVGSFVPGVPDYELDPEVVLVGILPPLLYAAAIRTSLIDFRRDKRAIGLLSIGLVAFTCVAVGLVTWWVVPGLPLAAGFALGAVVAPPDAVAATAVARRVGMPRRLINILEGESLVNDATALVALRTSLAALAGTVTALRIGFEFAVAAVGGVLVGLVVGQILVAVRRRWVRDAVLDTTLSFLAPFIAFLAAEEISIDGTHPSGVLAVVIAGLVLGHRSSIVQTAASRLAEQTNWRTVQFVLENTVFLLIGLQLRGVVEEASDTGLGVGRLIAVCTAVLLTAIVARLVWVYPATYIPRLIPSIRRADPSPPWTYILALGWAGMRGVVTLAAVFALPEPTPQRPVLVLAAFVVVAGTLLVQGSTLPALVRWLRLPAPDPADDALAEASALQAVAEAGRTRLHEIDDGLPDELLARLEQRSFDRANKAWERLGPITGRETPTAAYRRVRLEVLAAERSELRRLRSTRAVDEEVMRNVQSQLDVEESILDRSDDELDTSQGAPLRARGTGVKGCKHLRYEWPEVDAPADAVCPRCIEEGLEWVHLRMCLECGTVGCCDSSQGRHAEAHFDDEHHPVMRSVEPGEEWRWCYVDRQLG